MNSEIDIKKSSAMLASMYRNDDAVLTINELIKDGCRASIF
jgi:hypothetical protein